MPRSLENRPVLRRFLSILTALALLAAFFLAVIMGNPEHQPQAAPTPTPAPLTEPVDIASMEDFSALLNAFPAPVMAAMTTSALTLESATCQNVPYAKGNAIVATLQYRTQEEALVTVQSIAPAEALDVMGKGDFIITGQAGHPLAGLRSVQMVSPTQVRMHTVRDGVLYVITMPDAASSSLRTWTSAMQLFQGENP